MADITKAAGEDDPFGDAGTNLDDMLNVSEEIEATILQWNKNVADFRIKVNGAFGDIEAWIVKINNNLPPFLKLFTGESKPQAAAGDRLDPTTDMTDTFFDFESSPLLDTAKWAVGLWAVAKAAGAVLSIFGTLFNVFKFISGTAAFGWLISGGGTVLGVVTSGIGGLIIAVQTLWATVGAAFGYIIAIVGSFSLSMVIFIGLVIAAIASLVVYLSDFGGARAKMDAWANDMQTRFEEWSRNSFGWIEDWIIGTRDRFLQWAKDVPGRISDWFRDHVDFTKMKEIGLDMLAGLFGGFSPAAIWAAIVIVGTTIVTQFKKWFGIASPSSVMQDDIGVPMLSGIVQAFIDGVQEAGNRIVQKVIEMALMLVSPEQLQEWLDIGTDLANQAIEGITGVIYNANTIIWDALEWLRVNAFDSEMFTRFLQQGQGTRHIPCAWHEEGH